MNKLPQYFLKYFLPAIILLTIVFLPYCNKTSAAFTCEGNIFDTLEQIRDSGEESGGVRDVDDDAYVIFKIAGCALAQLTTYILSMIGIIAVIMIMIAGLRYMSSAGNPTAQQGAMKSLNAAVVGLAIAIMFWSLFNFLLAILRVK